MGLFDAFKGDSDDRIKPFFEVIQSKNDRAVFTNKPHPLNALGYKVESSL